MNERKSTSQKIYQIFLNNPNNIYKTKDLISLFNDVNKKSIINIMTKLYRKKLILRTPTQLPDGFYYSLSNSSLLDKIHKNHLLPYDFENKDELISKIWKSSFNNIDRKEYINFERFKENKFVNKYKLNYFKSIEKQQFLALIVGFLMCDGCIHKNRKGMYFYFRKKSDAKLFVKNFKEIFPKENLNIRLDTQGGSFSVNLLNASSSIKFFSELGAPVGNKVFQPFLIPSWIFYGSDKIKKVFLSTIIGNEGSAPSNNKWRIQFVLSKSKEHVPNLIDFLNQIRAMLYHFGIETSHIQLREQKGRNFHGRFYIKNQKNIRKFYKQFTFLYASEKQVVLEELINSSLKGRMRDD